MASRLLNVAAVLALICVVHARVVVFDVYPEGEAASSSDVDMGEVVEQRWTVDGSQTSSLLDLLDGTSSTITDERGASFTSALSPLLHPVSWLYQQLEAVEAMQRDMKNAMLVRQFSEAMQMQQQQLRGQVISSLDADADADRMLHRVGCQRFKHAMEEYMEAAQQEAFKSALEVERAAGGGQVTLEDLLGNDAGLVAINGELFEGVDDINGDARSDVTDLVSRKQEREKDDPRFVFLDSPYLDDYADSDVAHQREHDVPDFYPASESVADEESDDPFSDDDGGARDAADDDEAQLEQQRDWGASIFLLGGERGSASSSERSGPLAYLRGGSSSHWSLAANAPHDPFESQRLEAEYEGYEFEETDDPFWGRTRDRVSTTSKEVNVNSVRDQDDAAGDALIRVIAALFGSRGYERSAASADSREPEVLLASGLALERPAAAVSVHTAEVEAEPGSLAEGLAALYSDEEGAEAGDEAGFVLFDADGSPDWELLLMLALMLAALAMVAVFVHSWLRLNGAMRGCSGGGGARQVLLPVMVEHNGRMVRGVVMVSEDEYYADGADEEQGGALDCKGLGMAHGAKPGKGEGLYCCPGGTSNEEDPKAVLKRSQKQQQMLSVVVAAEFAQTELSGNK